MPKGTKVKDSKVAKKATKKDKVSKTNESISNLITAVFTKNYSEAGKQLNNILNEKIKSRINKLLER